MVNVLLLGAWTDQAFTFIRSLSRQPSVELHVADPWPESAGMHSRHVRPHLVPHYSDPDYIPALLDICHTHHIHVVIPLHHEDLVAIAPHKTAFTDRGHCLPIPKPTLVDDAVDKLYMARLAAHHNIATPRTYEFEDKMWQRLPFPRMIKLRRSTGQRGQRRVDNAAQCHDHLAQLLDHYPPDEILVQEYIPGTVLQSMWTVGLLYGQDHRLLACVPLKKVRSRAYTGGTAVCTVARTRPDVTLMAILVVRALGPWTGIADVEIKVNPEDGKPYFIELNPRPWGSIYGAYVADVDFPWLLVQVAQGLQPRPVIGFVDGIYGTVLSRDLALLRDLLAVLVKGPDRREALEVLCTYDQPYLRRRWGYPAAADFSLDDLKPFYKNARRLLRARK